MNDMQTILKRDNRKASFDASKITKCIDRAFEATVHNGESSLLSMSLTADVLKRLEAEYGSKAYKKKG